MPACLEDSSVMRVLLEANADVNAVEELGNTALHLASSWDCSDCVKLLCAAGADVNYRSSLTMAGKTQTAMIRTAPTVSRAVTTAQMTDARSHEHCP